MPTLEQMDLVVQRIEWLQSMSYLHEEGQIPSPASDLSLPEWEDLDREEQRAVLDADVDWEGFTNAERAGVIERVLDGENSDFWMDDIQHHSPEPVPLPVSQGEPSQHERGERTMASDKDRLHQVFDHIDRLKSAKHPAIVGSDKGYQIVERPWAEVPERSKLAMLQDLDWSNVSVRDRAHILLGQVDPGKISDVQRNRLIDEATRGTAGIADDDRPMTPGDWKAWREDVMAEDRAIRVMKYGEAHVAKMEEEARQRAAQEQPSPPRNVPTVTEAELSEMERGWSQPQGSNPTLSAESPGRMPGQIGQRTDFSELLRLPASRPDSRSDFERLLDDSGERAKAQPRDQGRDRGGPER